MNINYKRAFGGICNNHTTVDPGPYTWYEQLLESEDNTGRPTSI
jgi:hypothetical protein